MKLWYMTNIPVLKQSRNVGKYNGCRCFTADVMQTSFCKSLLSENFVYYDLNNSALDFLI